MLQYVDMLQMHISIMANKRLIIDIKARHSIPSPHPDPPMPYLITLCASVLLAWLLWPATPDAAPAPLASHAQTRATPAALPLPAIPATPVAVTRPAKAVPDEMQTWLAARYGSNPPLHQAMQQLAASWAQAIHEVHDQDSAHRAGVRIARAIACVMDPATLESSGQDQQWAYDQIIAARAEMLSRPADSDAYIRFQGLAAGQYFADPGATPCTAAPVTHP